MVDWFLDNCLGWLIAALVVGLLWLIVVGAMARGKLYDACVADGHKPYECYGMIRGRR